MYQLTVPYLVETDASGHINRRPNMPLAWKFEQSTSLLDTGPWARRGNGRERAVVCVRESDAEVEAWLNGAGASIVKNVHQLNSDVRGIREAKNFDGVALREYRAAYKEGYRSHVKREELKEIGRRGARLGGQLVIPFALFALFGEPSMMFAAMTPHTILIYDHWTGTLGDDVEGRAPDTIDPGGGTWLTTDGVDTIEISATAGTVVSNRGASAVARAACWHSGMSDIDAQFSETISIERNNGGIMVRNDGIGYRGYGTRHNGARIFRFTDPSTTTTLGSGSSNSGSQSGRFEIIGEDMSTYLSTPSGTWVLPGTAAWNTASDSTYATGRPGLFWTSTGTRNNGRWRGGSLQVDGGGGGGSGITASRLSIGGV